MFNIEISIQSPNFFNGKEKRQFEKKIILAIEQEFNKNVASLGNYPLYTFLHQEDEHNTYSLKFHKFLDENEDSYDLEKHLISFLKVDLSLNIL